MDSLKLTGLEQEMVARVADFTRRMIAPSAAAWDADGSALPRAVVRMGGVGLNALQVSCANGGSASFPAKIAVAETLASACMASAFALNNIPAIVTHAAKVPGGWETDGEKAWVTNGAIAGLLVLYAQTEAGAGARGIASFIVDLPRDIERARREIVAAGYAGEPVVVLTPSDYPRTNALANVAANMLRKCGLNVDLQEMD